MIGVHHGVGGVCGEMLCDEVRSGKSLAERVSSRAHVDAVRVIRVSRRAPVSYLSIQSTTAHKLRQVIEIQNRVVLCSLSFGLIDARIGSSTSPVTRICGNYWVVAVVCGRANVWVTAIIQQKGGGQAISDPIGGAFAIFVAFYPTGKQVENIPTGSKCRYRYRTAAKHLQFKAVARQSNRINAAQRAPSHIRVPVPHLRIRRVRRRNSRRVAGRKRKLSDTSLPFAEPFLGPALSTPELHKLFRLN